MPCAHTIEVGGVVSYLGDISVSLGMRVWSQGSTSPSMFRNPIEFTVNDPFVLSQPLYDNSRATWTGVIIRSRVESHWTVISMNKPVCSPTYFLAQPVESIYSSVTGITLGLVPRTHTRHALCICAH